MPPPGHSKMANSRDFLFSAGDGTMGLIKTNGGGIKLDSGKFPLCACCMGAWQFHGLFCRKRVFQLLSVFNLFKNIFYNQKVFLEYAGTE